jgi:hypothetical protein
MDGDSEPFLTCGELYSCSELKSLKQDYVVLCFLVKERILNAEGAGDCRSNPSLFAPH